MASFTPASRTDSLVVDKDSFSKMTDAPLSSSEIDSLKDMLASLSLKKEKGAATRTDLSTMDLLKDHLVKASKTRSIAEDVVKGIETFSDGDKTRREKEELKSLLAKGSSLTSADKYKIESLKTSLKDSLRLPTAREVSVVKSALADKKRRKSFASVRIEENLKVARAGRRITLCFMVDCTYSMDSSIAAVRDNIKQLVDTFKRMYPESVLNFGFVGYRDFDTDRFSIHPFTTDVIVFKNFVSGVAAKGGGDCAEDVAGGLEKACDLDWSVGGVGSSRALIHIADAPAHGAPYNGGSGDEKSSDYDDPIKYLHRLKAAKANYFFYKINSSTDTMIAKFNDAMKNEGVEDVAFVTTKKLDDIKRFSHEVLGTICTSVMRTHASSRAMSSVLSSMGATDYRMASVLEGIYEDCDDDASSESALPEPKTCVPTSPTEISWSSLTPYNIRLKTFFLPASLQQLRRRTLLVPAYHQPGGCAWTQMRWKPEPFAKGACRWAFRCQVKMEGPSGSYSEFVAKRFIVHASSYGTPDQGPSRYMGSIQDSAIAMFLAQQFNEDMAKKFGSSAKKVLYLPAYVGEANIDGRNEYFSLEPKLPEGKFQKWSNNAGDWDWEIAEKTLLKFAKYTFDATAGYMMVSDIQGVKDANGNFILTDPAVLCQDVDRFGSVNLGGGAMSATYEMARKLLEELS